MTPAEFASAIERWHDFFLAVAGASAALLGLLFVGVSINLSALAANDRLDLRTLAGQAFVNLVYVLSVSLTMLIPDPDQHGIAIGLAAIGVVGLIRVSGNARASLRSRVPRSHVLPIIRRLAWTVAADVVLLLTAARFFASGDAYMTYYLMGAVFVLLIGSADVSWSILNLVTHDAPEKG